MPLLYYVVFAEAIFMRQYLSKLKVIIGPVGIDDNNRIKIKKKFPERKTNADIYSFIYNTPVKRIMNGTLDSTFEVN